MRAARWIAAGCVAAAMGVGVAACTGSDADPAAAAGPPRAEVVRDCGSRGEPSGRPTRGSIAVGPVSFPGGFHVSPPSLFESRADQVGFRRYLRGRGRTLTTRELRRLAHLAETHHAPLKIGLQLRAGTRAVLAIAPQDRRHAALLYGNALDDRPVGRQVGPYWSVRVSDGQAVIALEACPASEPRFSGPGTVGPYTAFPGAAIVAGARCVTFQVWIEGATRPFEKTVPFGVRRCPESATAR